MTSVEMKEKKSSDSKIDRIPRTLNTDSYASSLEIKIDKDNGGVPGVPSNPKKRPSNLEDLLHEEKLTRDITEANFTLGDISDSEDIWVFDVPKTINPKNLKGQMVKLGEENDFQIGNEIYETNFITRYDNQQLSFVFNTGRRKRPYKTVNVKPAGCVKIRQKLGNALDVNLVSSEKGTVPFPKNLKMRHPLFGHNYNEKLVCIKK